MSAGNPLFENTAESFSGILKRNKVLCGNSGHPTSGSSSRLRPARLSENLDRSSAEIRNEVLKQVHSFLGEEQVQDDLALVVVRFQCCPDATNKSV